MYKPTFEGCWAKINRAKQHHDVLESYVAGYFSIEGNRPRLSAELDPASGYYIFRVVQSPDFTPLLTAVSIQLGDAVHNLRSALDHLTFQLALFKTNGKILKEDAVQFPIDDDPKVFKKHAKSYLAEADAAHVAIIEKFQPYNGLAGRPDSWSGPYIHQLALLRDLSNTDKHRLLNIIAAVPWAMQFALPEGVTLALLPPVIDGKFSGDVLFGNAGQRVGLGVEVMRTPLVGDNLPTEIEEAGELTPSVTLPERGPVVTEINRMADFVAQIIREFEPLF